MKLFLIMQTMRRGYDSYDSAVVAAETENDAQQMHPGDGGWYTWVEPQYVAAQYLGEAVDGTEAGVICSSFNAG